MSWAYLANRTSASPPMRREQCCLAQKGLGQDRRNLPWENGPQAQALTHNNCSRKHSSFLWTTRKKVTLPRREAQWPLAWLGEGEASAATA